MDSMPFSGRSGRRGDRSRGDGCAADRSRGEGREEEEGRSLGEGSGLSMPGEAWTRPPLPLLLGDTSRLSADKLPGPF